MTSTRPRRGGEDPDQLALARRAPAAASPVGPSSALVESASSRRTPRSPRRARAGRSLRRPADGRVLDAEVAGVHDRARRRLERDRGAVGGAVRERDELGAERARSGSAALYGDLHQLGVLEQAVLVELGPQQREREAPGVDRHLADRAEQERDGADVVLVAVGEDERLEGVAPLHDVAEVGQDDVHAHLVVLGEGDPAVDQHHAAVVLDDVHVLADLPRAARGGSRGRRRRSRGAPDRGQDARRATGCPAAPGRCAGCRARPASPRPAAGAAGRRG